MIIFTIIFILANTIQIQDYDGSEPAELFVFWGICLNKMGWDQQQTLCMSRKVLEFWLTTQYNLGLANSKSKCPSQLHIICQSV